MGATLTGKLSDITDSPVDGNTTKVYVKQPSYEMAGGGSVGTSAPAYVDVNEDGEFTVTLNNGRGYMYLEGEGWSDTIPFIVAEGMSLFIEAMANATGSASIYGWIKDLITSLGEDTEAELQALVDLAKTYADAAGSATATESVWNKGLLTSPVDILTLTPGRYNIASASVANDMGLPGNSRGELKVNYLDGPRGRLYGAFTWDIYSGGHLTYSNTSYNGKLATWTLDNWHKPPLTTSDNIVDLTPGRYTVLTEEVATSLGLPWHGLGYVEVEHLGSIAYTRVDWWTGVNPVHHWRISVYNKGWSAAVWEHLHGGGEDDEAAGDVYQDRAHDELLETLVTVNDPTTTYVDDRAALVADLESREGTPIVPPNTGAVALVFDHGTTAFRDWVWPALKQRGLTGTMALAPEIHLDGKGDARHQATNDEIKAWVAEGLAIASHSSDHDGAKTLTDIYRQVVVSKKVLEEKLDTRVDTWVQPGYLLSNGNYGGFGSGQSAGAYDSTLAGRLLQQTYPVITGYVGDDYVYPMEPLPVGVQRSLLERKDSVATVRGYVQQAADEGLKHVTFIHPYALLDSSDTYATKQDYLDLLDLIVSLRDAGRLMVMTLPHLALAQAGGASYTHNGEKMVLEGDTTGWSAWSIGRVYPAVGKYLVSLYGSGKLSYRTDDGFIGDSFTTPTVVEFTGNSDYILVSNGTAGTKVTFTPVS